MSSDRGITFEHMLEGLLAVSLLLEINSVFFKLSNVNLHISEVACVLVLLLFLYNIKKIFTKKVNIGLLIYIPYAVVLSLIQFDIANPDDYTTLIIKFCFYIPAMCIIYDADPMIAINIQRYFSKTIVILALMSCVSYIASYFINPITYITIDWGSTKTIPCYIFTNVIQTQELGSFHIVRNTGIYCEAPMYGFVLIMALAFELFSDYVSKKNISILIITILSTLSASAITLSAVLLFIRYIYSLTIDHTGKTISTKTKLALVIIPIAIFILVLLIFRVFIFKSNTGLSMTKRLDDYYAAFQAWITSPIVGLGYGNNDVIKNYMLDWRLRYSSVGFSNAVMAVLVSLGIAGMAIYIITFIDGIRKTVSIRKLKSIQMQYLSLIVLMFVTVVGFQLYTIQFIALGLSRLQDIEDMHESAQII